MASRKQQLPAVRAETAPAAVVAPPNHSTALAAYYAGQLSAIDKRLRIRAGPQSFAKPISTGLLCCDWVLSGGMRTAFNQVSGFEQAAKSSLMINTFGSAVRAQIPQIMVHDAEGCVTADTLIDCPSGQITVASLFEGLTFDREPCYLDKFVQVLDPFGQSTTAQLYFGGYQQTVTVKTSSGRRLEGANHPFIVMNEDGSARWVKIEDLKPGDQVLEQV